MSTNFQYSAWNIFRNAVHELPCLQEKDGKLGYWSRCGKEEEDKEQERSGESGESVSSMEKQHRE
jgi:hypothetical protein